MIDPDAKEKLIKSHYPDQIDSPQVAIDLLSTAYLEEEISRVFELPCQHPKFSTTWKWRLSRIFLNKRIGWQAL